MCGYMLPVVGVAFIGHMGDPIALSAAVLANSFFNITGAAAEQPPRSAAAEGCGVQKTGAPAPRAALGKPPWQGARGRWREHRHLQGPWRPRAEENYA
jgi:hypothetical protein